MNRFLTNLIDTLGGIWVLTTLALRSKFNFSSPYWTWRLHTAFPKGQPPKSPSGKPLTRPLALEYARWAWRIRRLR